MSDDQVLLFAERAPDVIHGVRIAPTLSGGFMSSADPALTGFPRAESDASRALRRWLVHLDDLQLVATARTDPTAIARPVLHHHGRSSGPSDDPSR